MPLPAELKKLPNFVIHRGKVPYQPVLSGWTPASSTDPSTWGSYVAALKARNASKADGIGFVFQEPYIGLDLDDAIVNGKMTDFAREIVNRCQSYTEYSPSRTGIHIFLKGKLPYSVKTHKKNPVTGEPKDFFEAYQNGRYFTVTEAALLSSPIRSVDDEFLNSLLSSIGADKKRRSIKEILTNIGEGSRNNDLFSVAASMRDRGYPADDIYAILEAKAKEINFPLEELALLCQSAGRYEPTIRTTDSQDGSLLTFMEDEKPVPYLVGGLIAENTINIMAGLPESGKSWLLLDLAVAIASGTEWLGKHDCKKRRVMVIDQERPKIQMQKRLKALATGRGLSLKDLEGRLMPFAGTTIRLNRDDSFDGLKRKLESMKPEVLLVDSLKTFQTEDIKDNRAMQAFMERVKELRNNFGLSIIFLHHETKGAYIRAREGLEVSAETIAGAASLSEVPETLFVVVKSGEDASIIYQIKNSYGFKKAPQIFKIVDQVPDGSSIRVEAN